jgi:hypothetical protein
MNDGFFTVGQRDGRWWFITPEGAPFWSIGMNHIDSATLRYLENVHIWRERYGGSQERWLRERVAPDLREWGFNTVGWVQEVIVREPDCHRHSRNFTPEEYQWLGLPYCHLLPFAETHQWECETAYPDVFGKGFEDWCDCVAREHCAAMADDPKLIGYFYVDCPTWVHCPDWNPKGPWFDPTLLESEQGRAEVRRASERYYRVTHDAVRRYDPHHLILGDRYEGMARVADEVLLSAAPYVDVMSFQYFAAGDRMVPDFARWHELTGRPVLLADACPPGRDQSAYGPLMRALRELPSCIGWHVCGAYLKNRCRGHGFRNEDETPVADLIAAATAANRETAEWVQSAGGP